MTNEELNKACEWLKNDLQGAISDNLLQRMLYKFCQEFKEEKK